MAMDRFCRLTTTWSFTSLLMAHFCMSAPLPGRMFLPEPDFQINPVAQPDTQVYPSPIEVIITAPRMTIPLRENQAATSVVGEEVLARMPKTIAADEALRLVPGVKVDNQAGGERVHVSIRGQGILSEHGLRGIRAILDGIPLNDPTGFTPDLYDVDWASARRVEILRGPAASLYGGSASAGVLNILTQNGGNSALQGDASAGYGSFGFWKALAQFGATVDQINYRTSLSRTMGDGYRDHTKYWANNFYGKVGWTVSPELTLTPILGWTDFFNENAEGLNLAQVHADPRQANPDAVPKNEYIQTSRFTAGTSALLQLSKHNELSSLIFVKRTVFGESVPSSVAHRTMEAPGVSLQYTLHHGEGFFRNHVSAGTDLQWQHIEQYKHPNLGFAREGDRFLARDAVDQRGIGVFLLDRVELGDHTGLTLSLRNDQIRHESTDLLRLGGVDLSGEAKFEKTTGRIGMTYSPTPVTNFYANWGMGFLPPATEELSANPDAQGGFNVHLTAAASQSEEIGFRGMWGDALFTDLTLFAMTTSDDFDRYRIPSRPLETFYRNSGSTRRLGAELYAKWSPLRAINLQLAYTFSDFKYTMTDRPRIIMDDPANIKYIEDGNWLPNSPAHQATLELLSEPLPDLRVGASILGFSRSYIDGANLEGESVAGYALVDARIEYRLSLAGVQSTLSVSGRNLFDREYVAFTEPDPGGNSYQPGPTREIFAGIRVGLGDR
jgi:iron complex outermembrane recepter protein